MADLQQLKGKYASVLGLINQLGVRLQNLHLQDNKLFLKARAQTRADSNRVWDQIKLINPNYAQDLTAEISYEAVTATAAAATTAGKTYTVQSGDTLSKIAKEQYGDAKLYLRIFEANRNILRDPDKIQVGQVLQIPQ